MPTQSIVVWPAMAPGALEEREDLSAYRKKSARCSWRAIPAAPGPSRAPGVRAHLTPPAPYVQATLCRAGSGSVSGGTALSVKAVHLHPWCASVTAYDVEGWRDLRQQEQPRAHTSVCPILFCITLLLAPLHMLLVTPPLRTCFALTVAHIRIASMTAVTRPR